jgi:hypothetical protein
MELSLKKTALALVALGLSGAASAGSYTPPAGCTGHNVMVPCEKSAWSFGAEGFYVEQTNDDMAYADVRTGAAALGGHTYEKIVDADFDFGFALNVDYHWGQGKDATLTWTRIHNSTGTDEIELPVPGALALQAKTPDPQGIGAINLINARARFEFDQVDGEIGQAWLVGDNLKARSHFGVSYVRIDRDFDVNANGANFILRSRDSSEFNGFGLRGGAEGFYDFYHEGPSHFGFMGSAAAALYAGDLGSQYYVDTQAVGGGAITRSHYARDDQRTIVPAAEAKAGLKYTYDMDNNGTIAIEGGWRIAGYFHTVKSQNSVVSNYGHHGPFLGISYVSA